MKSVLSGDTLVLSVGGEDKLVGLAFVAAPRLSSHEAGGFEARESMRELMVGKTVNFKILYTVQNRDYADISSPVFDSLVERQLREGWSKLREDAPVKQGWSVYGDKFERAQSEAQHEQKGLWNAANLPKPVQLVTELPQGVVGSNRRVPSIVEKVLGADRFSLRALLDPGYHYMGVVLLAGIRAPSEAAKAFVHARLLQRSVRAVFVGEGPGGHPLVNIIHPAGDIAKLLVLQGLADVSESHAASVGSERFAELREAQGQAAKARRGVWSNRVPVTSNEYEAIVVKVISADTFILDNGKMVSLATARGPRRNDPQQEPWFDSARDYVRKQLVGSKVAVAPIVSAKSSAPQTQPQPQPQNNQQDERERANIRLNHRDIALDLVEKGWAVSSQRGGELAEPESRSRQAKKGMHNPRVPASPGRLVDASENASHARSFLSGFIRRGKMTGIVEAVGGGARLRIYIPSERVLIATVPDGLRVNRADPLLQTFLTHHWLQRDVSVTVRQVDKTGAFISVVANKNTNLNVQLAQEGFAEVYESSAIEGGLLDRLEAAQSSAQTSSRGMWGREETTNSTNKKSAEVVAVPKSEDAFIMAVFGADISYRLAASSEQLSKIESEMARLPPAQSDFRPRRNELVGVVGASPSPARARVLGGARDAHELLFVDSGRKIQQSPSLKLKPLPQALQQIPPLAHTASLKGILAPPKDYAPDLAKFVREEVSEKTPIVISHDSKGYVTVYTENSRSASDSLNSRLIDNGCASVPLAQASENPELMELQKAAMADHIGMWEYGDPRSDEDL